MNIEPLPPQPPAGMTRYKVTARSNPFKTPWPTAYTQIADVDEKLTPQQVREFAAASLKAAGVSYSFLELEVVS